MPFIADCLQCSRVCSKNACSLTSPALLLSAVLHTTCACKAEKTKSLTPKALSRRWRVEPTRESTLDRQPASMPLASSSMMISLTYSPSGPSSSSKALLPACPRHTPVKLRLQFTDRLCGRHAKCPGEYDRSSRTQTLHRTAQQTRLCSMSVSASVSASCGMCLDAVYTGQPLFGWYTTLFDHSIIMLLTHIAAM